jgi:Uma2 family endonuclease
MAEAARKRLTLDEFLMWDDGTDRRYELVRGEVVAMAPASPRHSALLINIGAALKAGVKPPCRVFGEAGIVLPDQPDTWYEADIAVACHSDAWRGRYVTDPVLIVELLSPSNQSTDRRLKLPDYQRIESVREILLVATTTKRIEQWCRTESGWSLTQIGAGEVLRLGSFDIELPVEELYDGMIE